MVKRIFLPNGGKIGLIAYALALFIAGSAFVVVATASTTLPKGPATVTATDGLYLRKAPSRSADSILVMGYGSRVEILGGPRNAFYPVSFRGTRGWAHGGWLSPVAGTERPAIAKTDVYLRRGPGKNHAWITIIDQGSRVLVTGTARNGFLPVDYGQRSGWAAAQYLATPAPSGLKATVRAVLVHAGLGDQWAMADRIITCESGWNPAAENLAGPMRGLWQINWGVHADKFAGLNWKNPVHNPRVAIEVYHEAGDSWEPWQYCSASASGSSRVAG